jgi:hypothetical protein
MQVIPLSVQIVATVLSRNFGAADLQALFDVNPKTGKYVVLGKDNKGFWEWSRKYVGPFIEKSLTTKEGCLKPFKASVLGTGSMVAYFAALVGLLYGFSSALEKIFPGTFKAKQNHSRPEPPSLGSRFH